MDLASYDKTDPSFATDLLESQAHVAKIANWLRTKYKLISMRPMRLRPRPEEMAEYADDGDLVNCDAVIEVKCRRIDFEGKADFPYKTIFVDVAHHYDRASPKPIAYILTNRSSTKCLVVPGHTRDKWSLKTTRDRWKKRDRSFYECPIALCEGPYVIGGDTPPNLGLLYSYRHPAPTV